jgi:hypothetical protein
MAKPVARIVALQVAFGAGLVLIVARAGWLQLVRGRELARQAAHQRTKQVELTASRGTIYDRNGTQLVISQPKFRVQLALKEVKDTAALIRRMAADLRVPADSLRRMFRRGVPLYPFISRRPTAEPIPTESSPGRSSEPCQAMGARVSRVSSAHWTRCWPGSRASPSTSRTPRGGNSNRPTG